MAPGPLGGTHRRHPREIATQPRHARTDPAAVGLDLGLARASGADTGTGAGHRFTPAAQPGKQVRQLRELHLRLALAGGGVLGEDVEDQRGAVNDLDLDDLLQLAQLARGQLTVADHRVSAGGRPRRRAAPGPCRSPRRWPHQACCAAGRGLRAPASRRSRRARRARPASSPHQPGCRRVPDADEHHALEPQLAVLDLGDVFELRREPGDAAQRLAILEVEALSLGLEPRHGVKVLATAPTSGSTGSDCSGSVTGTRARAAAEVISPSSTRERGCVIRISLQEPIHEPVPPVRPAQPTPTRRRRAPPCGW